MRMRKKPNLGPRLARCAQVFIPEPQAFRGQWASRFAKERTAALHIELGCGKGRFAAGIAAQNPDILLVAVEKVASAMVIAMERICEAGLQNVLFLDMDAARLADVFAPGEAARIYINFCDPWPNRRHEKRRLTSPGFLSLYRTLLAPDGQIHFKTDNAALFDYSLEQLSNTGFRLSQITRDLHAGGVFGVMTDYEKKFYEAGVAIHRCVATRAEGTGEPECDSYRGT